MINLGTQLFTNTAMSSIDVRGLLYFPLGWGRYTVLAWKLFGLYGISDGAERSGVMSQGEPHTRTDLSYVDRVYHAATKLYASQ